MKTIKKILSGVYPLLILLVLSLCSEPEQPKPLITAVSPGQGEIGEPVVITGKNLSGVKSIQFGGVVSFAITQSDTEITTVVPPGVLPGSLVVTVTSDGGSSNTLTFTVLPSPPELTSIEPDKGSIGMTITLKGKHFTGASLVSIGTKTVTSLISPGETEVKLIIPEGLEPNAYDVTITTPGGTSDAATFTVVGKPVITSFSPTAGPVGKLVTITGLNLEETSKVFFGTVEAESSVKSATTVETIVPLTAVTSKIKVITPGGEALSENDFTVKAAPTITTFTPLSGIIGTPVTINGTGFDAGEAVVKFGTGKATDVTVVSATQITAKVPSSAITGKITVETVAGSAESVENFTIIGPPTIAAFSPTSAGIGMDVVITGNNFIGVSELKFNTTLVSTANFSVISPTQINAKVPVGATTGKISLKATAGTATSVDNFTIVAAPTISSFSPTIGPSGRVIAINGTNFTGVTKVLFGMGEAPFTFKTAILIEATVPTNAATGKIKVQTPGGEAVSAADFVVKGAPEITTFTPSSGIVGTPVTITGKNFDAGSVVVKFGTGKAVDVTVTNATQIIAKVPAAGTTGKITVETAAGSVLSANTFTVIGAPVVSSFSPPSGITGVDVTITGTNFVDVNQVKFNNTVVSAGNYTVVSATQIKAKVPAGAATGKIAIATNAGSGESSTEFIVFLPPTITSFTPTVGPVGREVVITGTNFNGATKVFFGSLEAVFTYQSSTSIKATVPASAVTGKIKVVTPGGEGTSVDNFTVKGPPEISGFTPGTGVVGATVVINGQNFDAGSVVVKFGTGTATDVTVVNATQISAKVPAAATTGKITVETVSGSVLSSNTFTVIGPPTITNFTPLSAGIGVEVTITGTNFIDVSGVKFNTTTAGGFTVVSATQIKVNVPAGATSGKISVTTPAGTATSSTDFTLLLPPTISSFTPSTGGPNATVTITGSGFTGTTAVAFNGVNVGASNFTINSATQITATVPGAATSGKITVTNPQGTATSANTFYVTPFITSLSAASATPSTVITINGTNLGGATVHFVGSTTKDVAPSSNTATAITVAVPSGLTGAVNINVTNAGGTSNNRPFTITAPPSSVVVTEIVATENITDQLLLFRGTNLTGVTKIKFGNTEASVFTNTAKVVTTKVPTSLSPGSYQVTLETPAGISNEKTFTVLASQHDNTGGVSMVIGASVSSLPPTYTPPISNQWINTFNTDQQFLIDGTNNTISFKENGVEQFASSIIYDIPNRYVEFTLGPVRYVGVWTLPTERDGTCFAHMTLISAESGKQLELEVENFGNCL